MAELLAASTSIPERPRHPHSVTVKVKNILPVCPHTPPSTPASGKFASAGPARYMYRVCYMSVVSHILLCEVWQPSKVAAMKETLRHRSMTLLSTSMTLVAIDAYLIIWIAIHNEVSLDIRQ